MCTTTVGVSELDDCSPAASAAGKTGKFAPRDASMAGSSAAWSPKHDASSEAVSSKLSHTEGADAMSISDAGAASSSAQPAEYAGTDGDAIPFEGMSVASEQSRKFRGSVSEKDSEPHMCVICFSDNNAQGLGQLCYVRPSSLTDCPRVRVNGKDSVVLPEQPRDEDGFGIRTSAMEQQLPEIPFLAPKATSGWFVVRACGHHLHQSCWDRHRALAVQSMPDHQPAHQVEIACPYCQRQVNGLMPTWKLPDDKSPAQEWTPEICVPCVDIPMLMKRRNLLRGSLAPFLYGDESVPKQVFPPQPPGDQDELNDLTTILGEAAVRMPGRATLAQCIRDCPDPAVKILEKDLANAQSLLLAKAVADTICIELFGDPKLPMLDTVFRSYMLATRDSESCPSRKERNMLFHRALEHVFLDAVVAL